VAKSANGDKPPTVTEVTAADVVAAVRSGNLDVRAWWIHTDTGAEQKVHDFWLVGDGVREALEIATLMDQEPLHPVHGYRIRPDHDVTDHRLGISRLLVPSRPARRAFVWSDRPA